MLIGFLIGLRLIGQGSRLRLSGSTVFFSFLFIFSSGASFLVSSSFLPGILFFSCLFLSFCDTVYLLVLFSWYIRNIPRPPCKMASRVCSALCVSFLSFFFGVLPSFLSFVDSRILFSSHVHSSLSGILFLLVSFLPGNRFTFFFFPLDI